MYDAYGKASVDAASTVTNNLRLPGQTGLHYNWQRYYDPAAGRYLSEDPIGIEGGLNLYHYTYQDPVNLSDPTGEFVPAIAVSYARCFATCQLTNAAASATGQCEFYTASCAASCANPMNWLRIGPRVGVKGIDDLFKEGRTPKASELKKYAEQQGWRSSQTANGPLKYTDENGINRITIKQGSSRAPGSANPHVEIRNASGQRVDPAGNPVTRKSPGNHTPIDFDL